MEMWYKVIIWIVVDVLRIFLSRLIVYEGWSWRKSWRIWIELQREGYLKKKLKWHVLTYVIKSGCMTSFESLFNLNNHRFCRLLEHNFFNLKLKKEKLNQLCSICSSISMHWELQPYTYVRHIIIPWILRELAGKERTCINFY